MGRISDTVKHLIIINVLVYIGAKLLLKENAENILGIHLPYDPDFRPYQIVSHFFMHSTSSLNHILFNMFGVYMFGSAIEFTIGQKKFLSLYLVSALGSMLLMLAFWHFFPSEYTLVTGDLPVGIGASGALFGLLAAYAFYYPNNKIMLLFFPVPIKAKYFVLGYAAIELFSGLRGVNDGVAHFAHLGGAIAGFLLIYYWRKSGQTN